MIKRKAENGEILQNPVKEIEGVQLRPLILGDSAYHSTTRLVNVVSDVTTTKISCCVLDKICLERCDYYIDNDGILQTVLRNKNVAWANRAPNT